MAGVSVIRYTNNPADYTRVDGIVVDERRPPGGILGIPGNKVCCIGEFERGPVNQLLAFGSTDQLIKTMGGLGPDASGNWYDGALSLRGKTWGRLYVVRVSNGSHAAADYSFEDGSAVNVLDIIADSLGAWGNSLSAQIADATNADANEFDLIITRSGSVVERHRNLNLADALDGENLPIQSNYIVATRVALGDGRPANIAATPLAGGVDGTFTDADYTGTPESVFEGIALMYGDAAADIRWVFCGNQSSANINTALENMATNATRKNAIMQGPVSNTAAQAISDVASYRLDRVGYCYPWVKIWVPEALNSTGGLVNVGPASFVANTLAAMAPGQNPAGPNGVRYLKGIRALVNPDISNANYEDFREQGIMGLQYTKQVQDYEIRSGINTSLDSALHNWARRNMADYIQEAIAEYLVSFRNKRINTKNKLEIKVAISDFLDYQIRQGLLPSDSDLNDNRAPGEPRLLTYEVDIATPNSPAQEANGIFIVDVRVRIFATMDFLVFRTEIGERVEVNEGGD